MDFRDILNEGGGISKLSALFTIDSKRDNKNTFLDRGDADDIRSNTNAHLPIKDKKLWKQMRAELVDATARKPCRGVLGLTLGNGALPSNPGKLLQWHAPVP